MSGGGGAGGPKELRKVTNLSVIGQPNIVTQLRTKNHIVCTTYYLVRPTYNYLVGTIYCTYDLLTRILIIITYYTYTTYYLIRSTCLVRMTYCVIMYDVLCRKYDFFCNTLPSRESLLYYLSRMSLTYTYVFIHLLV